MVVLRRDRDFPFAVFVAVVVLVGLSGAVCCWFGLVVVSDFFGFFFCFFFCLVFADVDFCLGFADADCLVAGLCFCCCGLVVSAWGVLGAVVSVGFSGAVGLSVAGAEGFWLRLSVAGTEGF